MSGIEGRPLWTNQNEGLHWRRRCQGIQTLMMMRRAEWEDAPPQTVTMKTTTAMTTRFVSIGPCKN